MNFRDAVITCFRKYARFGGRASRSEYWYFVLFETIASYVVQVVTSIVLTPLLTAHTQASLPGQPPHFDPEAFRIQLYSFLPSAIFWLILILPTLAVSVRRLHDVGRSGWWWWLNFIPIAGAIWLLVWQCTEGTIGDNR